MEKKLQFNSQHVLANRIKLYKAITFKNQFIADKESVNTYLEATKETRMILRAYFVPTSVPTLAEVLIFKDKLLHVAYSYLLHEHAKDLAPAERLSCHFWNRLLLCDAEKQSGCELLTQTLLVSWMSWERWTRTALLPLQRIFCFALASLPSGRAWFPGDTLCLPFSSSFSKQPHFPHNHTVIS